MTPQAMLLLVVAAALALLAIEALRHRRHLRRVPLRIHVNGTRGKSTVTRMTAAGLRAGGLRVVAKTTGSASRIILEDGTDRPIGRPGRPSISEQRRFLAWAAARGVDACVVECMAVRPEYQRASEDYLVRAQIGVITNVRLDHTEVLGGDLRTAARAFAASVPRGGTVLITDGPHRSLIEEGARRRCCRVVTVAPEGFEGELFPENTALAVEACRLAGVDPRVARQAMARVIPDPGAAAMRRIEVRGITVTWVNAFAANDPESARLILDRLLPAGNRVLVIYNHRPDRPLRTRAFIPLLAAIAPLRVLVVGDDARRAARVLIRGGLPAEAPPRGAAEEILHAAAAQVGDGGVIIGLGNIAGIGMALARLCGGETHD